MKRLSRPDDVDKTIAARELLSIHAARRIEVKLHDGYLTKMFYDHGIPVDEIADAYRISPHSVYAILKRQPVDCHPDLSPGDACTACGTMEVGA